MRLWREARCWVEVRVSTLEFIHLWWCCYICWCSDCCSLSRETRALLQNFGSSVIHKVEFRENFAMVGQKGLTRGTAIEQVCLLQLFCWIESFFLDKKQWQCVYCTVVNSRWREKQFSIPRNFSNFASLVNISNAQEQCGSIEQIMVSLQVVIVSLY